jgi:ribosomal protein S12 methylthiotransferase accessory factor
MTVAALRAALPHGSTADFDIATADRVGVPTVSADFAGTHWPRSWAFGYGADHEQARIGAYGELAEALLLHRHLRTVAPRRASYPELRAEVGPRGVADPMTLVLPAGTGYSPDQPLDWLPAQRWRTGEPVLVPAEFCASQTADLPWQHPSDRLITVITNGSGAGVGAERAVAHGLLELLQRHGNCTAFRAMDRGVLLDLDAVTDPATGSALHRLHAAGIDVQARLASTEFGIPVLHVVGLDADPATPPLAVTACGEAAHPDREVALRKAVLEYAASRARKVFVHSPLDRVRDLAPPDYWERELAHPVAPQEPRALDAMRAWSRMSAAQLQALLAATVFSRCRTVPFSGLPTVPAGSLNEPAALLGHLLDRLAELDVLVVLAPADAAPDAAPDAAIAAKVIVPGLEAETMSYGRIGERGVTRLLAREDPSLVGLGPPPHPGAAAVALPDDGARERLGGPAWLDRGAVDAVVGELYPLYREPDRHALARTS